ncbi:MAG TPA: S41 family peptidase [Gemmatimonadaceae bacterium]|nr:S41 family peptidase [Gemmatimonadaceae bacterium]
MIPRSFEIRRPLPALAVMVATSAALVLNAPPALAQHPEPPAGGTLSHAVVTATVDSAFALLRASYDSRSREVARWDSLQFVLRERVRDIRTIGELRAVLDTMIAHTRESHFSLVPREAAVSARNDRADGRHMDGPPGDAGFEVRLRADGFLVTRVEPLSPAGRAGVRPGWLLLSVDDLDAHVLHREVEDIADSTAKRRAIVDATMTVMRATHGPAGTRMTAGFRDEYNQPRSLRLVRRETPGQLVRFGNLPTTVQRFEYQRLERAAGCIGVLRFNVWLPALAKSVAAAMDSLSGCSGIVIDLRGNTGGVAAMIIGIAGYFVDEPRLLGTLRTRTGELRFTANPRVANDRGEPISPHLGPLALLVDELSVSTTELFASAMQSSGRARIFGERTAGQAQPSMLTRLPSGDLLLHVVADFVSPDGHAVEGVGVVPDVVAPWSRPALLAGQDSALVAAVRWIDGQPLTLRAKD